MDEKSGPRRWEREPPGSLRSAGRVLLAWLAPRWWLVVIVLAVAWLIIAALWLPITG
jgi:hypothetical protein